MKSQPRNHTISFEAASIEFGPVLTEDPGTCSVQAGHDLELGIPVTNQSGETVLLESARPVPLASGMLKVLSWRWEPCGFDSDGIIPENGRTRPWRHHLGHRRRPAPDRVPKPRPLAIPGHLLHQQPENHFQPARLPRPERRPLTAAAQPPPPSTRPRPSASLSQIFGPAYRLAH
jgi:hypothetical protein